MTEISEMDLYNQPDEGDPLVWLRKYRRELSERYPTVEELGAYYDTVPPIEEVIARVKREIAEKYPNGYKATAHAG